MCGDVIIINLVTINIKSILLSGSHGSYCKTYNNYGIHLLFFSAAMLYTYMLPNVLIVSVLS